MKNESRIWNMKSFPLRPLLPLLCAVTLTLLTPTMNGDDERCFLWKTSSGEATVFLFGSLHFGDPSMYPLDEAVMAAFKASDDLVVEINVADTGRESPAMLVMTEGMHGDGRTIRDDLSPKALAELKAYLGKKGLNIAMVEGMKPWCASLTIQTMSIVAAGYNPMLGVDRFFINAALKDGKEILELETPREQIKIFSGLSKNDQEALLINAIREADGVSAAFKTYLDVWQRGDADGLDKLIAKELKDHDSLRKRVFDDRNVKMTDKIIKFLNTDKTYFVVVGAGHLAGTKGVVSLLRDKDLNVEQIKRRNPAPSSTPSSKPEIPVIFNPRAAQALDMVERVAIPNGPDVPVGNSLKKDKHEWWREIFRETYQQHGDQNEIWDAAVNRFHDQYAAFVSGDYDDWKVFSEGLLATAKELIKLKCADPYVTYCVGNVLYFCENAKAAKPYVEKGLRHLEKSDYPNLFKFYGARRARLVNRALKGQRRDCERLWTRSVNHLAQSIGDDLARKHPRLVIDEIVEFWDRAKFDDKKRFYERAAKTDNPDPWLSLMIEAMYHVAKGWKARGSGWANTVTDEGWRILAEEMTAARKKFNAAYLSRPDLPHAAQRMISVRMASNGPVSEEEWFNRAVKAQMDYQKAYDSLMWAIRPRWGGSHEAMLAFGKKCLDTKRFDTDVPYNYVNALNDVLSEIPARRWRAALANAGVLEALTELYDGYMKCSAWKNKDRLKLEQAAYQVWSGRYEKAKSVIEPMDEKVFEQSFKGRNGKRLPFDKKSLMTEIDAFTGPFATPLKQAKSFFRDHDDEAAIALLKQTLPLIDDPVTRDHVFDWITQSVINDKGFRAFYRRGFPLHDAVDEGQIELAKFLIENGADVNRKDVSGVTPLLSATWLDEEKKVFRDELIKLLLDNGADVNIVSNDKIAPLHRAVFIHDPKLVDTLREHGADMNVQDQSGDTPLHWAVWNHKNDIVKQLLDADVKPDLPNAKGKTPLIYAILKNNPDALRLLLNQKVNLEAESDYGWRPIHFAAHYMGSEAVQILLDHGADPHALSKKLRGSFAHLAAQKSDLKTLQLAADKGVPLDVQTTIGETPLHLAMIGGKPEVVNFLLDKGARIDLQKRNGQTPLHIACHRGRPEAVKILIAAGANLAVKDKNGNTPADLARKKLAKASGKRKENYTRILEMLDKN